VDAVLVGPANVVLAVPLADPALRQHRVLLVHRAAQRKPIRALLEGPRVPLDGQALVATEVEVAAVIAVVPVEVAVLVAPSRMRATPRRIVWSLRAPFSTVLPGRAFRVELDNGHLVLAHISGKMRKRFIKLVTGDRVKMEMSSYDTDKARITYRLS